MGWGDKFKETWNSATDAARQKAAQLATGARQVGARVLETAQATADKAAAKATEALRWAKETTARVTQDLSHKASQVAQSAQRMASEAARAAQQKAGQVANAAQQKAALAAKQAKQAFASAKKKFNDVRAKQPVATCPLASSQSKVFYRDPPAHSLSPAQFREEVGVFKHVTPNSETSALFVRGEADAGPMGARFGAEGAVLDHTQTSYIGSNACNPFLRKDVQLRIGGAEAKGDFLFGYDQNRYGVALGGSLSAEALKKTVIREVNIPIPFTGWSISTRGGLGGAVGSVGPSGGGHAYVDKEEGRGHLGGFGGVGGGLFGLDGALDLSIGKKYTTPQRKTDF
jgi:hypothetical protein